MRTRLRHAAAAALIGSAGVMAVPATSTVVHAATTTFDIVGPAGSGDFGHFMHVLTNGNLVVVDDKFDTNGKADVGAVYLYNGATRALISTLTGDTANDQIGSGGINEVANSNLVVSSPQWNRPGFALQAGAATWINGAAGLSGTVSNTNSFVGASDGDHVGEAIVALTNGNYVIVSSAFDRGAMLAAGAVTFASGATGRTGSPTFGNSLLGDHSFDFVGSHGVTPLTNGNFVVASPQWTNGAQDSAGAVTFCLGNQAATNCTGEINPLSNSIVGTHTNDHVGSGPQDFGGVFPLSDGDYVVVSPEWNTDTLTDVGAVTWAGGTGGTFGPVSAANSLFGSTPSDRVGNSGLTALSNGNYAVASADWDRGAVGNAGAVTWGKGDGSTKGAVSALNSLVGSRPNDNVGLGGVTALDNGNYVVASSIWDRTDAIQDAGAATWVNGANGSPVGNITSANSLVGNIGNDNVGSGGVTALIGGNYVVSSPGWTSNGNSDAGAATWGAANGTTVGSVGEINSLVGLHPNDRVGSGGVVSLANGRYVVGSPDWDRGDVADAGASTLGKVDGTTKGAVSTTNSLVGVQAGDRVGVATFALPNSNYVTLSPEFANGAPATGAATFTSGATGLIGNVTSTNSVVGTSADDSLGNGGVIALPNSKFVVVSRVLDHNGVVDAGAATLGGLTGVVGAPTPASTVFGTVTNGVSSVANRYLPDGSVAIARRASNIVTLLNVQPDLGEPPLDPDPNNPGPVDPNDPGNLDYVAVSPARIVDTRPGFSTVDGVAAGSGSVPGGSVLEVKIGGRGGVPDLIPAATLNVTVTEAAAAGFATVFPCGQPQPTASNLNFERGSTIPNAVLSKVGEASKVCIFVSQDVQLIVDVNGYFPPTTSFVSLNPARVLDTRAGADHPTVDGVQQNTGIVAGNSVTAVQITGRADLPAGVVAVALNVTVTEPEAAGYVTVFPCGTAPPTASNLNHVVGQTIPNLVVAKVGEGGKVCLFNQMTAHLVVDVDGYFPVDTTYHPMNPTRLLDTRPGFETIDGEVAIGSSQTQQITAVRVAGRAGVPAEATTVVLNVTVTEPVADGYVTVYPCGIEPPLASNLNFAAGQTIPNAVIAKVGINARVCIFNSQPTHLVVDINGYFP